MPFASVNWQSNNRLSCAGCAPANVILCLRTGIVAQKACPANYVATPDNFAYTTIEAQLINYAQIKNSCGGSFYRYTFSYDDAQLVAGYSLVCADITGVVCEGCLTAWVEEKVGNDVSFARVGTNITATTEHGCQFTFAEGIPAATPLLTLTSTLGTQQPLLLGDTLSVIGGTSLTGTVGAVDTVTLDLNLSTDAGNVLTIGSDDAVYSPPFERFAFQGTQIAVVRDYTIIAPTSSAGGRDFWNESFNLGNIPTPPFVLGAGLKWVARIDFRLQYDAAFATLVNTINYQATYFPMSSLAPYSSTLLVINRAGGSVTPSTVGPTTTNNIDYISATWDINQAAVTPITVDFEWGAGAVLAAERPVVSIVIDAAAYYEIVRL